MLLCTRLAFLGLRLLLVLRFGVVVFRFDIRRTSILIVLASNLGCFCLCFLLRVSGFLLVLFLSLWDYSYVCIVYAVFFSVNIHVAF